MPIDWRLATSAAIGTVGLLVLWALPAAPSNFANWDADFELLLGNEHTADRPWRGTIAALAILPAPLSRREVRSVEELVAPEVRAALVARGASRPTGSRHSGGTGSQATPGRRHTSLVPSRRRAQRTHGHRPGGHSRRTPGWPRTHVSFSLDQFRRNFDLGQEGRRLVFRVRTRTSGWNHMTPHTETSPVLETNRFTTIAATFDGTVARVYVDGHLRGRTNLAAASCRVPTLCDADLPLATGALGGLLTVVALATVRPRSQIRIILLAALAAVVGIALLHLTHATLASSPV